MHEIHEKKSKQKTQWKSRTKWKCEWCYQFIFAAIFFRQAAFEILILFSVMSGFAPWQKKILTQWTFHGFFFLNLTTALCRYYHLSYVDKIKESVKAN